MVTPIHPCAVREAATLGALRIGYRDGELEQQLERAIAAARAGEFDGNEVAADGSDSYLYMYGPDADRLFAAVRATLEATEFMRGARVRLRYGPSDGGVQETQIDLGT